MEKVKTYPKLSAPSTTTSQVPLSATPSQVSQVPSQPSTVIPPVKSSIVSQLTQARAEALNKPKLPLSTPVKFSAAFYGGITFFLLLLAGGLTTLFILLAKSKSKNKLKNVQKKSKTKKSPRFDLTLNHPEETKVTPDTVFETVSETIPQTVATGLEKDVNTWEGEDPNPNSPKKPREDEKPKDEKPKGFPSLQEAKNGKEDTFAKQYSYENIHDSMYNRPRAKPSFSKLGGTSDNWESDVSLIKKEIETSGQTLEQFMDTTMAPIPEALADAWKASAYMPKKRYEVRDTLPKYAQ
jgi:hypothetical protein